MNTIWISASIIAAALILAFTAHGQVPRHHNEYVESPPHRLATLNLRAKGLLPNSVFAVFLTGSTNYIGEFETNEEGRGAMRVDAMPDSGPNLKHAVLRLSNPTVDDVCFTPAHVAEVSAIRTPSVATIVTGKSESRDDGTSLFHTTYWRFIKCVSTF